MLNIVNQVAFLRTSREFPAELNQLTVEVNRAYIDIANAVNNRIISIFPTNRPALTGEAWFFTNQRQQSFRQIYSFTSTASINHNVNVLEISQFTRCWGTFTDGTNWYGLNFASNVAIAGQITFYITPNASITNLNGQIVFVTGAGAPTLTSGTIVLEWLAELGTKNQP